MALTKFEDFAYKNTLKLSQPKLEDPTARYGYPPRFILCIFWHEYAPQIQCF